MEKWKKALIKTPQNTGITSIGKNYLGNFPNLDNYTRKVVTKAKMCGISKIFLHARER